MSVAERFLSKVDSNGVCWEWTAGRSRGYGVFSTEGRMVRAHKYLYEALMGPVPAGLVLDHLCRNRACVNPDHIQAVTSRTNTLRGAGVTAVNARKTHCPKGHPYEGKNVIHHKRGGRGCRACCLAADQRYKARLARAVDL